MDNRRIIAIDFDGVLHSFTSGWTETCNITDPPTKGAIAWLTKLVHIYNVVIFSARNEDVDAICAMKRWLFEHGMLWIDIDKLEFPTKKPACHLLIDDRCFCFKGKFPTVSEINNFMPWHGNGVW